MFKKVIVIFTFILVTIFALGCSKNTEFEASRELTNFINAKNVKNIEIQVMLKTNSGFENKIYRKIEEKSDIENIVDKVNLQKFIRYDCIKDLNNKFDSSKIDIENNDKLEGVLIILNFNKPMFENNNLLLQFSTTTKGVEFSAKKTNRGYDTEYISLDTQFIIQIFNEYSH